MIKIHKEPQVDHRLEVEVDLARQLRTGSLKKRQTVNEEQELKRINTRQFTTTRTQILLGAPSG